MNTVIATYDGRAFVPQTPINLPIGFTLEIPIPVSTEVETEKKPLVELMELLDQLPANPELPNDFAVQHDHYLYGTSKNVENDPH